MAIRVFACISARLGQNRRMDFSLILDCIVIVIIIVSAAVAFLRGFVREVLTILGLVGASLTALTAGPMLAPGIEEWFINNNGGEPGKIMGFVPYDIAASVCAYAGLFIISMIVLSIISHWIAKSVHAIGLGPVDRSLGVVFGIIRAIVLIGLLYMPFHLLMEKNDKENWFGDSFTHSYVEYSADLLSGLMPEGIQKDDEGEEKEELDPLNGLTGDDKPAKPEIQPLPDTGTDEEAADAEQSGGYNDLQRRAIEGLIEHQDKIRGIITEESN